MIKINNFRGDLRVHSAHRQCWYRATLNYSSNASGFVTADVSVMLPRKTYIFTTKNSVYSIKAPQTFSSILKTKPPINTS